MDSPPPIFIGACAWSYDDWNGAFYPETLPKQQRLAYYARYLNAVEIDSTFYGAPSPKTAVHWSGATPESFLFSCKMPREITHERKLRDCQEPLSAFLRSVEPLASKLGCVLIQLPPYFHPGSDEFALREFIQTLPSTPRFAIEFRDPSWHAPRIAHMLQAHDVCWAWNDLTPLDHRNEGAFDFLPQTTDFLYVRLMGDLETKYIENGEQVIYNRLRWPRKASLESWAIRVRQHLEKAARVLIFASNHFEGFAPLSSQRMAEALGLTTNLPDLRPCDHGEDQQMELRL